ncbi:three-Cys-motif partner protein TcmP [Solimonas sp. SE-A11]|uniref:three-Cys-motif partner protein TcmP n=1 Tax=Solimonas sp. SE-A11 TaxID=3054954 RepID=UPI00259CD274|nr:three-Cys-motif partner protein TcmP [Solimonas sp. SE-A11]MDM4770887.1 three-Cys-motif partner protein TcmP [Solimonas sp. SE-A11]
MTAKPYRFVEGAVLEDHTKKKHDVLSQYFRQYLIVRCQLPQQERFRLAIVDGFAGGGRYACGSYGSPLIFVDTLIKTTNEINTRRAANAMKPIQIECLLILNDIDRSVVEVLKENLAPLEASAKVEATNLRLVIEYHNDAFETIYPVIKARINSAGCSNVFFNLDQCGYKFVTSQLIRDIMASWKRAEVLLTFMISTILAYLSPDKEKSRVPLEAEVQARIDAIKADQQLLTKSNWLGVCEKIIFEHLRECASFVSPFSITNPNGWHYWLMHFATSYRARQVYNDVLHSDGLSQAHFGKSGLRMLAYDPLAGSGQLYLFDGSSRQKAIDSLNEDIPRFIAESGDSLSVEEFYTAAYNETPAHSDDIHRSIIECTDIEVITPNGGRRREPHAIDIGDTLKLKSQKSFVFGF